MIGDALRESRAIREWSQETVGRIINVSTSLIHEVERGRRWLSDELKPVLARKLDCYRFYMAIKRLVTGDVMTAPELDGPMVDRHRAVAVDKAIEEMEEAIAALKAMKPFLYIPPEQANDKIKAAISERVLHEAIEAHTGLENMVAWVAEDYGISLAGLWDKHRAELKEKGYIKK